MKFGFPALCIVILFLSPRISSAQADQNDSLLQQKALSHTLAIFTHQVADQSRLYNGRHYNPYPFRFKEGTPFLDSLIFRNGAVLYDNILYPDIPLLFDVLGQRLITKDQDFDLQLIDERVGYFKLPSHYFIRIVTDSLIRGSLRTGYYEVLYPGKSMLLKKLYKTVQEEPTTTEGILRTITETTDYFLKTGTGYYSRVNSKRELLDAVSDYKKDIQRYIKKSKLKYHRQKEQILVQVAAYYDHIKK